MTPRRTTGDLAAPYRPGAPSVLAPLLAVQERRFADRTDPAIVVGIADAIVKQQRAA